MRVANGKCIRRLSFRTLAANRARNLVAILAIALTAVLFTSLFTIALSINEGFQQSNFRQAGGWSHGTFKDLTEEQYTALQDDPLIAQRGKRQFLGMPSEVPFNKSHVEISYCDANTAHWMYCDPVEGRLPQEGTEEAATDLHVLELLGVEPKLGAEFTVTFFVDGHETTQTFTLCGWWEYDDVIIANHILVPQSRVEAVLDEVGVTPPGSDGMTGNYTMYVMLKSGSRHIERDLLQILENHGYQSDTPGETYINIGINWGYTGAQLSSSMDPITLLGIIAVLVLILLTGYLIIYNVFQISVAGDIRFYGLLKTIGTTPRQLRRIIRIQALSLSVVGIPVGLVLGWLLGSVLTPVVAGNLNGIVPVVSVSPWIFVGSAAFALITVLISCRRPGRMAGKVSPVEAVRYTEGTVARRRERREKKRVSLFSMAWANLGRSRGKTTITILSLSLAVVLLHLAVTFTNGFDMNKYIAQFTASDFIVADAGQFQTGGDTFNADMAVPQSVMDTIDAQGGMEAGGKIYGKTFDAVEFVTEEYYRSVWSKYDSPETLDLRIASMERLPDGRLMDRVQLYGMDPFALDYLTVLEGDLSALYEPGSNAIAAVYSEDDYGQAEMDSHWARLGDTVTIRYVEREEYYNLDTGEIYGDWENIPAPEVTNWGSRVAEYRDVDYTVAALVTVPSALSYRYYGADEFIMGSETFCRDSGTDSIMYYTFDMESDEATASMESFLADYTENENPQFDYESKATYAGEFESFRNMFALLGGTLSFIVGLVGVLNFFNAILTGITVRRREFAVLQSIGMTGPQLKRMLILEGLLYTLGSLLLSLALTVVTAPLLAGAISRMFWFFTYHFTILPIVALLPVFLLLGVLLPLVSYRRASRSTVVERLRQE